MENNSGILAFWRVSRYNTLRRIQGVRAMPKQTSYRGCFLGLAVGDAMGYTVDDRDLEQIRTDYGPEGLLGYDLVNGYADVTSYTQLAAFTCNGLLLGLTRGQMQGIMAPYVRYIAAAQREWAQTQRYSGSISQSACWVGKERDLKGRRCMDTRMLDTINQGWAGSMEEPVNRFDAPGAMTVAIPVGMFFNPLRMDREEICRLGAEAVALTHGAPQAFLVGAALAHIISRIIWDGVSDLKALVKETGECLKEQFGREYPQVVEVAEKLNLALRLAAAHNITCCDAMEQLRCTTMAEILAGGIYAAVCHPNSFDEAMITAVNHSGRSAAVGAVTGAILGAKLGEEEIPEFYLEPLEPAEILRDLADDVLNGCPMDKGSRLFDGDWDSKYLHGSRN